MDKEKQDRFDCKHLECNADGSYCKAGHGSIRGYGHCVIPYEQETCKYFEKKPKTKTLKINENEVVISKEEKQKLLKEMYEQGRFDAIADLEKDGKVAISKEEYDRLKDNIVDLKYDKIELKQEISEKENKIKLLEETIECIKFNVDFTRKETSREIFEELYMHFNSDYLCGLRNPNKDSNAERLTIRLAKQYGVDLGEEE